VSEIEEITRRIEDGPGASRGFLANFGQNKHRAMAPFHQLDPEQCFELVDLHGQRWLADTAILSGSAKVPMSRECVEVMQLP
jgi:hypothetical protein